MESTNSRAAEESSNSEEQKAAAEEREYEQSAQEQVTEAAEELQAKTCDWYSKAYEFVEENPVSTAAGVAAGVGVLLGAALIGRRAFRSEPTTMQAIQAKMADALCSAAELLDSTKHRAEDLSQEAAEKGAEFRGAAEDKFHVLREQIAKSASQLAQELPGGIERASRRGAEAISNAVKERPSAVGLAAAAAIAAFGAVALSKSGKLTVTRKRPGKSRTLRASDFAESTREELYEQARKLGIAGRSAMSKEELVQALKRH